jgi:hypothetical protein
MLHFSSPHIADLEKTPLALAKIFAMIPANKGAPDAKAIPKHNGTATKNTTMLAGKSFLKFLNRLI